MENIIINTNDGLKQIDAIQFGVLSNTDISKLSSIELVNRGLYNENREPIPYGPLDLRLGVSEKGKTCGTCFKKIADCPGHFGHIRLEIPIFHIGYFKFIINILQCICKDCGRILLKNEDKDSLRMRLKRKNISSIARDKIFKNIIESCKKVKNCLHCDGFNGVVKHVHGLDATLIIHERYNVKKNPEMLNVLKSRFDAASMFFKEIESSYAKITEELTSQKVHNLFLKIPKEEFIFFDMDYHHTRPIDLLTHYVIVPPLSIRPTVPVGYNVTNEDDLTIKIGEILFLDKRIKAAIAEGHNTSKLIEDISYLQHTHAQFINTDTKGLNKNLLGNKPIRSLCTRLKGKQGRFRGNLSGKRVDFTGRTVISPDPNLKIDQVGVPLLMAKVLTYPQRVTSFNVNEMRKFVLNGPEVHPGANFVELSNGNKIFLAYTSRKKIAEELKIGDIIERHLMDDDIILFNRQPSLHRQSIMAFRAKILPWRTLRFNECCCTPFNADFDGDEMNIHLPQTEEAKSEALYLMGVKENLITPKSAEPLVAATQDFLTTFFLITQRDYFLDRARFFKFLAYFGDANEKIDIPPPCVIKPQELWSGKQLFSLLLRPNKKSKVLVNLEVKAKNYSKLYKKDEFRCPNDGYVIIKNSELLTGNIDKTTIGNSSKTGVVFTLIKDNNRHICAEILCRISKFSARWIGDYGMSFGIGDVLPKPDLNKTKDELIIESYKTSDEQINLYEKGQISLKAGMNAEQSLESILNKVLSDVREKIGGYLRTTMPKKNPALIMAVCGSKGSDINLSQMIACLGQQIVSGQRIGNGFYNRTLPHFEHNSKYPAAKGFVKNSFYTGLDATEFFFHTVGGREGLVDTAVKTAETGYMQRRLVKALEDLTVQYNNSVTISSGEILQFVYGDDGIDPMNTDDNNKTVNFARLLNIIKACYPCKQTDRLLSPKEIIYQCNQEIIKCPLPYVNDQFIEELKTFFNGFTKNIESLENLYLSNPKEEEKKKLQSIVNGISSISQVQIKEYFRILWLKYKRAMIVPGEAVGAVAAMSIGEPGTQMTLKTFHFAGVASMNITLGVPRIKEIINSTKSISTPVIFAKLLQENDLMAAKIVKGRIEKTKLSEIIEYVKEVMSPKGAFLKVKLDMKTIESMKLEISMNQIKEAILKTKKLNKLKEKNIFIESSTKLKIEPWETSRENMYFNIQFIKRKLTDVIVSGIDTISRAVINKRDKKPGEMEDSYILAIEGTGLKEVMQTPGINHKQCTSNDINEVERVLGIEAARSTIINEIKFTFGGHGIQVDCRHLQLIADLMTFKGHVLGFQRHGMTKMKESVLMHSSFEKTNDILFDSAFHSRNDDIKGVSECIITGKSIPLGTGIFKTLYDPAKHNMNKFQKLKFNQNSNIIEEKIRSLAERVNYSKKHEISNLMSFNLVDNIR